MKNPYWGLWALLAAALAFFAVLSFWPDGIRVGGMDLKTPSLGRIISDDAEDSDTTVTDSLDANGRLPNGHHPKGWRAPMDTTAKNILFIGDSMLEGLGERLAAYCKKSGHTRGSTVDLTLFDMATEKEVDMGGTFDWFGRESHPDFGGNPNTGKYKPNDRITAEQFHNRMILREAMMHHGFKPIGEEWWHFTLKNEPFPNTYFTFPVKKL